VDLGGTDDAAFDFREGLELGEETRQALYGLLVGSCNGGSPYLYLDLLVSWYSVASEKPLLEFMTIVSY